MVDPISFSVAIATMITSVAAAYSALKNGKKLNTNNSQTIGEHVESIRTDQQIVKSDLDTFQATVTKHIADDAVAFALMNESLSKIKGGMGI